MLSRPQNILIIGSNILGNATASRRFKEAIASLPNTRTTFVAIDQADIDATPLPSWIRRYQLIPTYLAMRKRLKELSTRIGHFDLIFVVTCQPLTALHGLWPQARVALWFDGLPHHPGKGCKSYVLNALVKRLYQPAFSRVQFLLPMSKWASEHLSQFSFPRLQNTFLSPTRVAREVWGNASARPASPGAIIRVLMVGNNAKGKGFIDFFQWCQTHGKDLSKFQFTIVSKECNTTLKQVTQGFQIEFMEDLHHGDLTRLVAAYHASDLFFLPTKLDMMPNVLIEAAASRLPCIASDMGAISEVVHHGRTGWLVEAQRWDLFYNQLLAFAMQPDQFSAEALAAHAEHFFDERMRDDLMAIVFAKP